MIDKLSRHWFMAGLAVVAVVTLFDGSGIVPGLGLRLSMARGAEGAIALIFFLSGLNLSASALKKGASDVPVIAASLFTIFLAAPALAGGLALLPLDPGLVIGLFIVASMPTTLSTGVVMTSAAGGNPATALAITILASWIGIVSVPFTLTILAGRVVGIQFDAVAMALQIAGLIVAPLFAGMLLRGLLPGLIGPAARRTGVVNQLLVLAIVWMALSKSGDVIASQPTTLVVTSALSAFYHLFVLGAAFVLINVCGLRPGRREPVVFMGGQKTLPLSILVQTTIFPAYGQALVFCVVHHLVHLIMDGYLVGLMARRSQA